MDMYTVFFLSCACIGLLVFGVLVTALVLAAPMHSSYISRQEGE